MLTCAVYGCTNSTVTNTDPNIQYYYFPKHPVFAQQWVVACWRSDPIDINNAQICSIHFDNNCYSSEYKMLDYLGHYARMLKYDAIPNLYLPNPHTPVIMKAIEQPLTITAETIATQDIKDIMIYEVQAVPEQTSSNYNTNDVKDYITINPRLQVQQQNAIVEQETDTLEMEDQEKYGHITNREQLETVKSENATLRQDVERMESVLKKLQSQLNEKRSIFKNQKEALEKLEQQRDALFVTRMGVADQKNILSKAFSESQIKILSGKKKIYWSNDDMAMGYTIRHLSNKRCYMYLSKNLKIPLPALSSIKRWCTLKKNEFEKEQKKSEVKFEDEDSID